MSLAGLVTVHYGIVSNLLSVRCVGSPTCTTVHAHGQCRWVSGPLGWVLLPVAVPGWIKTVEAADALQQ